METAKQSLAWRIFVVFLILVPGVGSLRDLTSRIPSFNSLTSAAIVVAVMGVTAWAYGYRVGPRLWWRVFAVGFAFLTAWAVGRILSDLVGEFHSAPWTVIAGDMTAVPVFALMCLALFRYGAEPNQDHRLAQQFL